MDCRTACYFRNPRKTISRYGMLISFTGALFFLVMAAGGCSRKAAEKEDSPPTVVKSSDPNVIESEHPERFPLVEVTGRTITDEIGANGVVAPDVNRSVAVLSLSGGRVTEIRAKLGDDVRKGQLLLRIQSPDLAAAFSDYQKAQADEILAGKQFDRSRALYDRGAIAEKDLEAARNAEDKAKVFSGNARRVYPRLDASLKARGL